MRVLLLSVLGAALAFGQGPAVGEGGVVNAASFALGQPVAPGSLVSIFGSNLAAGLAQASSIPLSTELGDVSAVTINGVKAPLMFVAAGQINAQVPWEVQAGPANVVVTRGGVSSAPVTFTVGAAAPGIFSLQSGTGQAIAINNTDGSLAAPAGSVPGIPTHPAAANAVVILLGTGLGAVNPPAVTANNSIDKLRSTPTPAVVLIGGKPAQVIFSGMSPQFVGVNQINVVVPAGVTPGGTVPVQIQMGGITSTDKVTMAVQ